MGFRDINAINQALLTKQSWWLVKYPDSLVAKLYTAKYFLNNTLLEAEVGNNPSFTWCSLV